MRADAIRGALVAAGLSVLGWVLLLGLVLLVASCGEPPRAGYTLNLSGVRVSDPAGLETPLHLEWVFARIVDAAPPGDMVRVLRALEGATLVLEDAPRVECIEDHDVGCADGDVMTVAWRTCEDLWPTAGVIAHEVGHLAGFDHGDPWYGFPTPRAPVAGSVEERLWHAECFEVRP